MPVHATDCLGLVDHYLSLRASSPVELPDIFPDWKGTDSLPFLFVDEEFQSSTELACDTAGRMERLRYSWGWTSEKIELNEIEKTLSAMLELSDFVAPYSMALVHAFDRTVKTRHAETEDFPGPYRVTMEVLNLGESGGAITMTIHRDTN